MWDHDHMITCTRIYQCDVAPLDIVLMKVIVGLYSLYSHICSRAGSTVGGNGSRPGSARSGGSVGGASVRSAGSAAAGGGVRSASRPGTIRHAQLGL